MKSADYVLVNLQSIIPSIVWNSKKYPLDSLLNSQLLDQNACIYHHVGSMKCWLTQCGSFYLPIDANKKMKSSPKSENLLSIKISWKQVPQQKVWLWKALNRCMIWLNCQKRAIQLLIACGELTQCWLSLNFGNLYWQEKV